MPTCPVVMFRYQRSLDVLAAARADWVITTSHLILGMGETPQEVTVAMQDLHDTGCDILTIRLVPALVAAPPPVWSAPPIAPGSLRPIHRPTTTRRRRSATSPRTAHRRTKGESGARTSERRSPASRPPDAAGRLRPPSSLFRYRPNRPVRQNTTELMKTVVGQCKTAGDYTADRNALPRGVAMTTHAAKPLTSRTLVAHNVGHGAANRNVSLARPDQTAHGGHWPSTQRSQGRGWRECGPRGGPASVVLFPNVRKTRTVDPRGSTVIPGQRHS